MALTERSRSTLYQRLSDVIEDEEAVGEMLSYFPARDVEEPATKEIVTATAADIRAEMASMETGIRGDMAAMERGIREDMAAMERGIRGDMAAMERGIREDMVAMERGIREDMVAMERRLTTLIHSEVQRSMRWTIAATAGLCSLLAAVVAAVS